MFRPNNPFITTAQTRPHISVKLASNLQRELVIKVSACPVSLAATKGIMQTSCLVRTIADLERQEVCVYFSLFLWVLRCFTSPGSLHSPYVFR